MTTTVKTIVETVVPTSGLSKRAMPIIVAIDEAKILTMLFPKSL